MKKKKSYILVKIIYNFCKLDLEQKQWPIYAKLSNSQIVGADLIIFATGVLPNCDWVDGSLRQEEGKGIFVNASMQTSANDVYAAGDVCCADWKWAKHWFQVYTEIENINSLNEYVDDLDFLDEVMDPSKADGTHRWKINVFFSQEYRCKS